MSWNNITPALLPKEDLITRLRKRAEIRKQIASRKSVQEGKPDRLADLLDEAANKIESLQIVNKVVVLPSEAAQHLANHLMLELVEEYIYGAFDSQLMAKVIQEYWDSLL